MKKRRLQQSDIVWAVLAALLVFLQFYWLPGEKGATSDSYSASIDGKLGLYRTLSKLFPQVVRDQSRICPEKPAALLMIAPDRYPTTLEIERLHKFVSNGGCLLVAPNMSVSELDMPLLGVKLKSRFNWQTGTATPAAPGTPVTPVIPATPDNNPAFIPVDSDEPPTIEVPPPRTDAEPSPTETPAEATSEATAETSDGASKETGDASAPKTAAAVKPSDVGQLAEMSASSQLSPTPVEWRARSELVPPNTYEWKALVSTNPTIPPGIGTSSGPQVEVAVWNVGAGTVMVSSSPDVFSNRSLLIPESRRLCIRLIEELYRNTPVDATGVREPLILCEFLNASQAYRDTGVLFSPALRNGSLQLILLAVLAGWLGFHRFGPALRQQNAQRRSLTESAAAVGNLQYRQQDGGAAVRSQLDYLKSQLRRRYGANVRLDQSDALAVRSGIPAEEIAARLKDAEQMAVSRGVPSSAAAEMIRWLSKLNESLARTQKTTPQKK